jgi:molybdopterin molybdotransferase
MPELIEITDARRLVANRLEPLEAEPVELRRTLGRVVAENVTSAEDVPGFDSSAMDGYAVRAADTVGATADRPARLRVVDESRAGHPAGRSAAPGEAIAISTGAVVPRDADAVVRVEDTDGGREEVEVRAEVEPGRDIRRAADDIRAGETVLLAGSEIGAAEAGVIASVGRASVRCSRRPRVALLTTGDELRDPGEPLELGAIRNSNAYSVAGLIERAGAELLDPGIVPDDREATREAIGAALGAHVAVLCGGVSVGEHDHVRPALEALGVEQVFWGVALRPGKPTYFGIAPSGALVFALPGNPVSAMVTFLLFVRPAIRGLLGADDAGAPRTTAILDEPYEKRPGRAHLVRCTLRLADDGWHARPTKEQGSHVLTSMLGADALAIVPTASGSLAAGDRVEVELLR